MAKNHISITDKQAEALVTFMDPQMVSVDEHVESFGQETAFRIWDVYNRLKKLVNKGG